MATPDDPQKNVAEMGEKKGDSMTMTKYVSIGIVAFLLLMAVGVSAVSAATIFQDKGAKVTYNSFTTTVDTPQHYYKVIYWAAGSQGKQRLTALAYNEKTATTITIKVPYKWQSKLIYYQVCTWQDQYGNHGDCGKTFSVQLARHHYWWKR